MRSRSLAAAFLAVTLLGCAANAAAETASGAIVVSVVFGPRTSLKVSTQVLRFDVTSAGAPATVALDFSAAVRTQSGADVVLSVEATRGIEGSGAADVESMLTFTGEGEGTVAGSISTNRPSVAGRWVGSGRRTGRLIFSLRTTTPGDYTVPVRFVLSTP